MLAALMRHIVSSPLGFAWICLLSFVCLSFGSCVGGIGTTCFQNDECDGELTCCHIGSQFTQGSCETQTVCNELRQGLGGVGGAGGAGGGAGGAGGVGGAGGGAGGQGGMSGGGGMGAIGGAGGQAGMGGGAGSGGAPVL